ncbi:NAD(P)H-quinone oxidoreductase [Phycisphaerales bacterium AB-hyl4]|uniref:NAD(P)H-quinone oxidoreductase n=1 Tax=Natronomicrosphaera hydrolytica TaxID=3242702 RepID=A0ABV4U5Q7_9BACT
MHVIKIAEDRSLRWVEVPDPVIKDDEILIDVRAAALNRADLLQRAGHYPPPPGWPDWMGLEVAGTVSKAPADSRWQVGDKVCALLGGGGYAEQVAVPADMVLPIPEGLSFVEAAAIPEAFATSHLNLCIEGGLQSGDTAFIQAGASGLGVAAIQLAKAIGAKVVTTVGSDDKAALVNRLGADVVINHRKENVAEVLARHPVNVAMDCVAGPDLGSYLETVAAGCRWIVIATLGGSTSDINMNSFFRRGIKLIGSTLRSRTTQMKAEILADLEKQYWQAFSSRQIQLLIHKALPITQAEQAHAILERNENLGKVVLTIE